MNRRLVGFYTLAFILGLGILWVGGITLSSTLQMRARVTIPAVAFDAHGGDPARGKHFVTAILSCRECHGSDLGGAPFVTSGPGRIYAPNLTPGGVGLAFTDTDFERAIRHGLARNGTKLYFMPSQAYAALSDADLRDVIAYLRTLPAVDRPTPPREISYLGRMMVVTHTLPAAADHIDHTLPHAALQPPGADAAYGKYLTKIAGCFQCHGPDLAGGRYEGGPDVPAASNLTPSALGGWTQAQFATALRTGRDPRGKELNAFMPWRGYAGLSDNEMSALYAFLKSVPPVKS